jgi:hypothetical protein
MTATILSETTITGLPSASGIEIVGNTAYVIGDDTSSLHLLNAGTLTPTGRISLFDVDPSGPARIPKAQKPDLECMAALQGANGPAGLLLLGSGSLPTRARGWFVPLVPNPVARPLDLAPLYALLVPHLPPGWC